MNYPDILSKLVARTDLSEDETFALFDELFHGNLTDAQIGAFLAALSAKGETVARRSSPPARAPSSPSTATAPAPAARARPTASRRSASTSRASPR